MPAGNTGFAATWAGQIFFSSGSLPIFNTFARHTKSTHKSQPCKGLKIPTPQAHPLPNGPNSYELPPKHQQNSNHFILTSPMKTKSTTFRHTINNQNAKFVNINNNHDELCQQ